MTNANRKLNGRKDLGASAVNEPVATWPSATVIQSPIANNSAKAHDWLDTPAGKEYLLEQIKKAAEYNKLHPETYTSEEMRRIMHKHIHNYAKHKGLIK